MSSLNMRWVIGALVLAGIIAAVVVYAVSSGGGGGSGY